MTPSPPIARVYGGRPVEQRQQARRDRLLEAGLELFGTVGFKGTSVRAVLQHAQLSERYFGESFTDLRQLFRAVYDGAIDKVLATTMAAVAAAVGDNESSASDEIRAGMEAFFEAVMADPRYARILLVEVVAVGPSSFDHGMSKLDIFSTFVAYRATELGLASEQLSLDTLAKALVGAGNELLRQAVFGSSPLPVAVAIDHAVFLYEATFQALRARARPANEQASEQATPVAE